MGAKYDVVKDYDWTSAPRGSGIRKKAPRVWVKSYKINSSQIINRLKGYMNISASGDAESFYDKMYSDSTTAEDDFNFPFFNDNIRSFGNSFSDTFGANDPIAAADGILSTAANLGGHIGTALGTENVNKLTSIASDSEGDKMKRAFDVFKNGSGSDPGSYIEVPKLYCYDSNSDSPLEVSFVLSNTINSDYDKNYKLIQRLTYINRPLRKNSIAVDPPRIYQVKVPGHRFIRWAYCSSFSVSMMGSKREIDGVIVPEAYQINMAFQSLTMEHAGFLKKA